jgi:hypothetical protein
MVKTVISPPSDEGSGKMSAGGAAGRITVMAMGNVFARGGGWQGPLPDAGGWRFVTNIRVKAPA